MAPLADECWGDGDGNNAVDIADFAGDTTDPPTFKGFTTVFVGPTVPPIP
jgi:hypothetical protein